MAKNQVFESDNISRSIMTLALPTIVSQLITTFYNLADTFWVGRLGHPEQLAALAIVFPTQMIITALGNLFGIGAGTCIAARLGARDEVNAKRASSFAIYAGCIITAIYVLCVILLRGVFLKILGSTAIIEPFVNQYINWVIIGGALPTVFNLIIANMLRGEGDSLKASLGLSGGGILNMVLDPFFVLPFGLNMEIEGAAIATLISNVATTVYFVIVLAKKRRTTMISFSPKLAQATKFMGANVIFTGVPSALQTLLSAVSNLVLNSLMIGYGETAEAAVGIIKKIDAIPMGCIQGLAQGATPLMAFNYGAQRYPKMMKTLKLTLIYGVAGAGVILILVEIFAPELNGIFISDPATIEYGTSFLRLHCIAMPFMAISFGLVAFFQSVGAKARAFVLSLTRKGIIDVPMMFLMNTLIPMIGIVACQPISDFISAAFGGILFLLWWKKFKKQVGKPDNIG